MSSGKTKPFTVNVLIYGAKGLKPKKSKHKFSIVFGIGKSKFRTDIVEDLFDNPVFNKEISVPVDNTDQELKFKVTEKHEKDVLGQVVVPLNELRNQKMNTPERVPLRAHKKCSNPAGELLFEAWIISAPNILDKPLSRATSSESVKSTSSLPSGLKKLKDKLSNSPLIKSHSGKDKPVKGSSESLFTLKTRGAVSCQDLTRESPFYIPTDNASLQNATADTTNKDFSEKPRSYEKRISVHLDKVSEYTGTKPEVTGISPKVGTSNGGTVLTIRGSDLGLNKDDLVSISVCGLDLTGTVKYISSNKLICTTGPWKPCVGNIIIETQSGGRGTSTVQFTFCEENKRETVSEEPEHVEKLSQGLENGSVLAESGSPFFKKTLTVVTEDTEKTQNCVRSEFAVKELSNTQYVNFDVIPESTIDDFMDGKTETINAWEITDKTETESESTLTPAKQVEVSTAKISETLTHDICNLETEVTAAVMETPDNGWANFQNRYSHKISDISEQENTSFDGLADHFLVGFSTANGHGEKESNSVFSEDSSNFSKGDALILNGVSEHYDFEKMQRNAKNETSQEISQMMVDFKDSFEKNSKEINPSVIDCFTSPNSIDTSETPPIFEKLDTPEALHEENLSSLTELPVVKKSNIAEADIFKEVLASNPLFENKHEISTNNSSEQSNIVTKNGSSQGSWKVENHLFVPAVKDKVSKQEETTARWNVENKPFIPAVTLGKDMEVSKQEETTARWNVEMKPFVPAVTLGEDVEMELSKQEKTTARWNVENKPIVPALTLGKDLEVSKQEETTARWDVESKLFVPAVTLGEDVELSKQEETTARWNVENKPIVPALTLGKDLEVSKQEEITARWDVESKLFVPAVTHGKNVEVSKQDETMAMMSTSSVRQAPPIVEIQPMRMTNRLVTCNTATKVPPRKPPRIRQLEESKFFEYSSRNTDDDDVESVGLLPDIYTSYNNQKKLKELEEEIEITVKTEENENKKIKDLKAELLNKDHQIRELVEQKKALQEERNLLQRYIEALISRALTYCPEILCTDDKI